MKNIEMRRIQVNEIPAILWGKDSKKLYLYIHGQGGYKEEAEMFSKIVNQYGWQVLSIDLPEHGERKNEINSFDPWHVVPELSMIMEYAKSRWEKISLFANSIGAWFSMLSFEKENFWNCLFVSPVVDMKKLIAKMMNWANVSETQLEKERIIPTDFGQTLSWEYWQYVLAHPILKWKIPTKILYGEKDHLVDRQIIEEFAYKFNCDLTIMKNGEHWFHTKQQLDVMHKWIKNTF